MNNKKPLELTFTAIALGLIIGIIMTAANVYLGLYAGMTVSASIPAAVIAMGVFRVISKKDSLLQSNIVQTMASAGESLAAGIIFTVPALLIVGAWQDFNFWPTTIIAISGGILGVVFMVPLRRALIIEEKELIYPEGVACAAVLQEGSKSEGKGHITILKGLAIGALFKWLTGGVKLLQGSVEKAFYLGDKTWFIGTDISPALMAVGYIVKLEVALLVLFGGIIGWFIGIPMMGVTADQLASAPLDTAWSLWSGQIRYLGVGAMIVGGLASIFSVRKSFAKGMGEIKKSMFHHSAHSQRERTDTDLHPLALLVLLVINIAVMSGLYYYLIGNWGDTILTTFLMVIASFLFVAVSSYIVGLVGSSNNPVSGMTISALLGTAAFFLVLGHKDQSAIMATLGVAAVVCCAACTAGDCSQDLKTGSILGATPKMQQIAQIIGVVIPAFVIAPVLSLLHHAYGIGTGLKAPQATLFASITKALFGDGSLPLRMVLIGMLIGLAILFFDHLLQKRNAHFRLYLMPIAVGIYLPITLAIPMFMGGLARFLIEKRREKEILDSSDNGVLMSSGLIAGEAIMGVVLAIFLTLGLKLELQWLSPVTSEIISTLALIAVTIYLYRVSKKSP